MPSHLNLLNEIAGKESENQEAAKNGKFRTSVMTTYTAYLPFYENVVLRRLIASGCRYNVLLVDAQDLSRSLQDPTRMPRLAGKNYVLAPISAKGAFHPKIIMLLGEHHARALVGSHNTTLSGFGYNRELTTRVDLERGLEGENRAFFQHAWKMIEGWVSSQQDSLPTKLSDAILRVGHDRNQWLQESDEQSSDTIFLGSHPEGESLWEKAFPYLPKYPNRVTVMGPFFDKEGAFVNRLHTDLTPQDISIALDVNSENISLCKQEGLPQSVTFHDASELILEASSSSLKNPSYLHAKALFVDALDNPVLITGSANPSAPAWLGSSASRNAEAVVLHRGDEAHKIAARLGLLTIPTLPTLQDSKLKEIYAKATIKQDTSTPTRKRFLVAEATGKGLLIPGTFLRAKDVSACNAYFEHEPEARTLSVQDLPDGLLVELASDQLFATKIELALNDGGSVHLFVHNHIAISKLATTSRQQTFQDALDSLGGDSPDYEALLRVTYQLVFEDGTEKKVQKVIGPREVNRNNDSDEILGPLSVPLDETKHQQRKQREIHHSDLAFVIDKLIYHLGIGLHDAVGRVDAFNLSEEEQVGREDENELDNLVGVSKTSLLKVCHSKIGTLVNRMCKRFESVEADTSDGAKAIEQLLAILAVLREIRVNDLKLSHATENESLVPLRERRKLLDAALEALFGDRKNLFDLILELYKDDPENDMPRLLGLLLWLAWDCDLEIRNINLIPRYNNELRRNSLIELAKILVIAARAGRITAAFKEAEHSIWRMCKEDQKAMSASWLARLRKWSDELAQIYSFPESFTTNQKPKPGQLGAVGNPSKLRLILSCVENKVYMAEFGRGTNEAVFTTGSVTTVPMPSFFS